MTAVLRAEEPSARYLVEIEPTLTRGFELLATAPSGVATLRGLILFLAVQGRLEAQVAADASSAELLELASVMRASAGGRRKKGASGKLTPHEVAKAVPAGWCVASLGEVAVRITDGSHNPPRDAGIGIPMLSSQNVLDGKIDFSSPSRYVSEQDFLVEDARTAIAPGDVLLTIVASLGRSAVVPSNAPRFALQRSVAVIRSPLNASYLSMFFRSPLARAYYDKHGKGTAQKGIYLGKLSEMPIPIPPLAEQHRIVARVEELMKLCDAMEQSGRLADEQHARLTSTLFDALAASESAHALAENWQRFAEHFDLLLDRPEAIDALEQTILRLAVRGLLVAQERTDESALELLARIAAVSSPARVRPALSAPASDNPKDAVPFELPGGWTWARFGNVARIASNLVLPARHPDAWQIGPDCIEKGTGRLLSRRTVRESKIISANHSFSAGQILYSKIRPSLSKAVIVDFGGLCSADMYPIEARIAPQFLLLVMLSEVFLDQVKEAENRVKMPKLNQEALNRFVLPVPPLAEQHRIVARVEELRRLCADLREQLEQARETQSRIADALVAEVT